MATIEMGKTPGNPVLGQFCKGTNSFVIEIVSTTMFKNHIIAETPSKVVAESCDLLLRE